MNQVGPYLGTVKSYNSKKGYGFIDCPAARAVYGRDVFIHKAQMGELLGRFVGPGTRLDPKCLHMHVRFSVGSNREGMPQARDVTRVDAPPNSDMASYGLAPSLADAEVPVFQSFSCFGGPPPMEGPPPGPDFQRSSGHGGNNNEPRSYRGRGGTIRLSQAQEAGMSNGSDFLPPGDSHRMHQGQRGADGRGSKDRRKGKGGSSGSHSQPGGKNGASKAAMQGMGQEQMGWGTNCSPPGPNADDLRSLSEDFLLRQQQQPQFIASPIYPQLCGGAPLAQPALAPFGACAPACPRPDSPSGFGLNGLVPGSPEQQSCSATFGGQDQASCPGHIQFLSQYAATVAPPAPFPAYLPQVQFQPERPETPGSQTGSPPSPSPIHLSPQVQSPQDQMSSSLQDLQPQQLPLQQQQRQQQQQQQPVAPQQHIPLQAQQPLQIPLPGQHPQYLLPFQQALMGPAQMAARLGDAPCMVRPPGTMCSQGAAALAPTLTPALVPSLIYGPQVGLNDAGTPTSRQSFGFGGFQGEDNPRTAPSTPDAVSPGGRSGSGHEDAPHRAPPLSPLYLNGLETTPLPSFGALGVPSPMWPRMDGVGLDQQVQESVSHSL
eukprot:CAMPEP_0178417430 /NCGR_PEP_ID=MMETSP0689_2-20121128/24569_1 /TAXON_ID=160604 /ORGANISM="Amphidinium massartii, Strain CS-259" /LENGTH=601 /DNA_ID=CAMNT_0020038793 /DNA_START=85 /DNA_END=1890 /DNA_ORIENTATION=+